MRLLPFHCLGFAYFAIVVAHETCHVTQLKQRDFAGANGLSTHDIASPPALPAAHVANVHFVAALFANIADALLVVFPKLARIASKERMGVRFAASCARPFKRVAAHYPTAFLIRAAQSVTPSTSARSHSSATHKSSSRSIARAFQPATASSIPLHDSTLALQSQHST